MKETSGEALRSVLHLGQKFPGIAPLQFAIFLKHIFVSIWPLKHCYCYHHYYLNYYYYYYYHYYHHY